MNAKLAKKLRKKAIGYDYVVYEEKQLSQRRYGKTVFIKPECVRAHYKELKKNVHR